MGDSGFHVARPGRKRHEIVRSQSHEWKNWHGSAESTQMSSIFWFGGWNLDDSTFKTNGLFVILLSSWISWLHRAVAWACLRSSLFCNKLFSFPCGNSRETGWSFSGSSARHLLRRCRQLQRLPRLLSHTSFSSSLTIWVGPTLASTAPPPRQRMRSKDSWRFKLQPSINWWRRATWLRVHHHPITDSQIPSASQCGFPESIAEKVLKLSWSAQPS